MFCLDDGAELLYGPASTDEPATAILRAMEAPGEVGTQAQVNTTSETEVLVANSGDSIPKPRGFNLRLLAASILLAVIVLAGFFGYRYIQPASGEQINSIAVLPFANASGDKETEFLSDGISETLINNFTKIPELKVAARSTAFRFRGREDEPKEIGRLLGVGSILTGKLIQRGDNISVQVDLVSTTNGLQIWGNRYEGKAADIVRIQQRIATDVSAQLKLKLTGAQTQQIAKTYTQNSDAYQHYLRGRYHWNKRTAEDLKRGLQEFQQAAEKDPNYALAYVGLADTYVLLEEYAGALSTETLPKARAYAQKALEIDDSLGEANATLGLIYTRSWQWLEAENEFKKAIDLNPNYPTVHHWRSVNLRDMGRPDDAMPEIKRAQELDPLSLIIGSSVGVMYLYKNDDNSAVTHLRETIELDPSWWGSYHWLGIAHLRFGRNQQAVGEFQKAVELSNRSGWPVSFLGYTYGVTGKSSEARAILNELQEKYPKREATALQIAAVHLGLQDKESGIEWVEKAARDRSGELVRIMWYPPFDSLHGDPRYESIVRQLGLPE